MSNPINRDWLAERLRNIVERSVNQSIVIEVEPNAYTVEITREEFSFLLALLQKAEG